MSERFETDRFLSDFSKAWSKQDLDAEPPRYVLDEAAAYERQQKASSTTVDFGYAVHVVYDDQSDRVGISTPRGFAEIQRSQCAEIGRLLMSLAAPEVVNPGWAGGADTLRSAPAYEQRPNAPGWKSQHEKNIEAMERALGIRDR